MKSMIRVARPYISEEEIKAAQKVLNSGNYISGNTVQKFEELFAQYIGVEYCVALNSGTSALHLALAVARIKPGDEVIVPPMTFFSTVSSVLYQRAIPIFTDIDPNNWCLDPYDVEKKITERTKAVFVVHLYGNMADMDSFERIRKKYNILVIEDAAQAHGAMYGKKKAGAFGDMSCFSFFATKHMTTGGEGGAITTQRHKWAEEARTIRNHGMSDRHTHRFLGYNYRMTELEAAIGIIQLRRMPSRNEKRENNSLSLLEKIKGLELDWLTTPSINPKVKHAFFWCPVLIDEKKLGAKTRSVVEYLRSKGIETRNRYWEPLYRQPVLSKSYLKSHFPDIFRSFPDYENLRLPIAERVSGKIIGLPNRPDLKDEELDYIVSVIESIKGSQL
jgi:dTDP-4-amino-4,6-dideoxygalactose transaminase